LNGLALLGAIVARPSFDFAAGRKQAVIALLICALGVMAADYYAVYLPLVEAVTPPGKPRTPEFAALHRTSMWVNLAGLLLCAIAAGLVNWPAKSATETV
jgi:hypothetical protein